MAYRNTKDLNSLCSSTISLHSVTTYNVWYQKETQTAKTKTVIKYPSTNIQILSDNGVIVSQAWHHNSITLNFTYPPLALSSATFHSRLKTELFKISYPGSTPAP